MLRRVGLMLALGLFVIFAALFYGQYFQWRGCFNEAGRCFDPETGVVYQVQSGMVWLLPAVLVLCFALVLMWQGRR
jgi:hypothetical protein